MGQAFSLSKHAPLAARTRRSNNHRVTPEPPHPDPAPPDPDRLTSHGAHLLVPIARADDGSRVAACPVCVTGAALPPTGGWIVVRCASCGTEFVASDGSPPPPLPPPIVLAVAEWEPEPLPEPVRLPEPAPEPVPYLPPPPVPPPDGALEFPHGRLWDYCPNCGHAALTPERIGDAYTLTCVVCGGLIIVSHGVPPRPPALPAPPSVWERIRRWFGG